MRRAPFAIRTLRRYSSSALFAAFHRREQKARYDGLNPAEKVVLNFAKFVAANKHARYFLVGYVVTMHLVVSGAMYVASHHC